MEDRKVPAPARIVPALFGARVISSVTTKENEGRGGGDVQRVKTKKPGKEKNYKRTGTGCLLAGEGVPIHSSRAYSYISRIAACFFRVPRLCKRTFTISYAAIHLNETRGRAKRKKLNIGPSGYAA